MDILTAEEKLAHWVESVTGMNGKVYRIFLPQGVGEGFEVKLLSGKPQTVNSLNEFTVEIKGVSPDRRMLWECFEKLFAALPLQKYESILYMDIKGEVSFDLEEKGGMQLFSGTIQVSAAFA